MSEDNQQKKLTTRILVPIIMFLFGAVFTYLGVTQYGFWDHEPKPGFFPVIFGTVLMVASVLTFFQVVKETEPVTYHIGEVQVMLGALLLIVGSLVIGMIPMIFVYLFVWLKIIEKTPFGTCLIIMAIVGAIVIGIFVIWLQVQFPWGLLQSFIR